MFVQATIFNPAAKTISTYNPLVIDEGTTPAIVPTPPALPPHAVVALFGGGDDDVTQLVDPHNQGCVNGAGGKLFGQVWFCNAQNFFAAVNAAGIAIPPLGTESRTGLPCPTVRDFRIVDQDQSDNVQTTYLVLPDGQTAQNTAANRAALGISTSVKNPSDNRLLTNFVDPNIGCTPWKVPVLEDPGAVSATQATDELQAARYQSAPTAFIPLGDPMVGPGDLSMVNAYRVNVDQPFTASATGALTQPYCSKMRDKFPPWVAAHAADFTGKPSPAPGTDLYTFIQNRFSASLTILGCK